MALSSTSVFEVRTTGSDLNAGGFNPSRGGGGVDRSQQDSPHVDIDNGELIVTVHTTTTQVSGTFLTVSTADLGNFLQITGGTATAGVYEITAVDTINRRWTLDRSAGTAGQTIVGRMGGAFATPGKVAGVAVTGNKCWIKSGTYTIGSGTGNTSGNKVDTSLNNIAIRFEGYETTRGDRTAKPLFQPSSGSITIFNGGASAHYSQFANLKVNGNGQSSITAFTQASARSNIVDCEAISCATGFSTTSIRCYAESCTTGFSVNIGCVACVAKSCATGFNSTNSAIFTDCIASGGTTGFTSAAGVAFVAVNCTSYGNSGNGFAENQNGFRAINCLSVNNTGKGFAENGNDANAIYLACAAYNNAGGTDRSPTALTADPFINAASGNFALNSTAGGGAACKAAGIPGAFPGGLTTGYLDIGAVQSQASTVAGFTGEILR